MLLAGAASSMQRAASAACGRTCALKPTAHFARARADRPTQTCPACSACWRAAGLFGGARKDVTPWPSRSRNKPQGSVPAPTCSVHRLSSMGHACNARCQPRAARPRSHSRRPPAQWRRRRLRASSEAVRACLPGRPPARPPRATLHPPCTQPDAPLSHRRPSLPILDPPPLHPRACLATRAARRGCFDFRPLRRATLPHRPPAPPGPS